MASSFTQDFKINNILEEIKMNDFKIDPKKMEEITFRFLEIIGIVKSNKFNDISIYGISNNIMNYDITICTEYKQHDHGNEYESKYVTYPGELTYNCVDSVNKGGIQIDFTKEKEWKPEKFIVDVKYCAKSVGKRCYISGCYSFDMCVVRLIIDKFDSVKVDKIFNLMDNDPHYDWRSEYDHDIMKIFGKNAAEIKSSNIPKYKFSFNSTD